VWLPLEPLECQAFRVLAEAVSEGTYTKHEVERSLGAAVGLELSQELLRVPAGKR
jgi:hypothetical protein